MQPPASQDSGQYRAALRSASQFRKQTSQESEELAAQLSGIRKVSVSQTPSMQDTDTAPSSPDTDTDDDDTVPLPSDISDTAEVDASPRDGDGGSADGRTRASSDAKRASV